MKMRRILLLSLTQFLPILILAQQSIVSVEEYSIENNANSFKREKQDISYSAVNKTISNGNSKKHLIDSLLFNGKVNTYIGPIEIDGSKIVYLIKNVNASYRMRVGHLLIDPINNSESAIDSIAKKILSDYKAGVSFDSLCSLYGYTNNGKYDGDLGWFNSGDMVKEFEQAVLEHKKNDVFRVKTTFGTHIVKVLEDSIEKSRIVTFIEIKLK